MVKSRNPVIELIELREKHEALKLLVNELRTSRDVSVCAHENGRHVTEWWARVNSVLAG